MTNPRIVSLRVATSRVYRFALLTLVMSFGIFLLALIESVVLWGLGIAYSPKMEICSAGVWDFAIADSRQWAVSRIVYTRNSSGQGLRSEVLVHDMQRPQQARCVDVPGYARQVAISSRGDRLAIACYDGSIYLGSAVPVADPPRLLVQLPQGEGHRLACSPDGKLLAAVACQSLYLWRLPAGELLHRIAYQGTPITELSFTADGQRLLTIGLHGRMDLWDTVDGELLQSFQVGEEIQQAALSLDGRSIIMATTRGVQKGELDSGSGDESLQVLRTFGKLTGPVAISRDGAIIATVSHESNNRFSIHWWDVQSGKKAGELPGAVGYVNGLVFTPDGTLYTWDSTGRIFGWDLTNRRLSFRFCALTWAQSEPSLQQPVAEQERM